MKYVAKDVHLRLDWRVKKKRWELSLNVKYAATGGGPTYTLGIYTDKAQAMEAADIALNILVHETPMLCDLVHPAFNGPMFKPDRARKAPKFQPILVHYSTITDTGHVGGRTVEMDTLYLQRKFTRYYERHGDTIFKPKHKIGPMEWMGQTILEMCGYG